MKKIALYTIINVVIMIVACSKKHYDVKSDKNLTTPSSLEDLQAILDNAKIFNRFSPRMNEAAADYVFAQPDMFTYFLDFDKNAYTWSKDYPNNKVIDWSNGNNGGSSYTRVYQTNLVLETLDKISTDENKSVHDNVRGQAFFHRGRSFYELASTFSPPPYDENLNKNYGIPLRLEADILIKSERSTVKETYDQILSDLESAVELLPLNQNFKTRPSKIAAYAMLARVYLSMENYAKALQNANLALEHLSGTLVEYKDLDYNDAGNPFNGYISEVIFYNYMNSVSTFSPQTLNIDSVLYKSYDDNDLRKKVFFNKDINTGFVFYKGTYAGVGIDHFFNGLATDELYLIRAECLARDNQVGEAMISLNTVLEKRWLSSFVPYSAFDSEEALKIILIERKKELVLRGTRWSDLRRLNRDPRFAQTFTRTLNNKTYILEPNSYKYTFPIPDDIIEFTGMEQNEGWQ